MDRSPAGNISGRECVIECLSLAKEEMESVLTFNTFRSDMAGLLE